MECWNDIHSRLNGGKLLRVASSLADGSLCDFDGPPIYRKEWMILRLRFYTTGKLWAARIPVNQENSFLKLSAQPLEFITRNHPRLPAPRLHCYSDTGADIDNPVGVAYILVDWIIGKPLQPWSLDQPSVSVKRKFLISWLRLCFQCYYRQTSMAIFYFMVDVVVSVSALRSDLS